MNKPIVVGEIAKMSLYLVQLQAEVIKDEPSGDTVYEKLIDLCSSTRAIVVSSSPEMSNERIQKFLMLPTA